MTVSRIRLLGAMLLLGAATQAWSHAKPLQQTPATDAVVVAPHQVRIDFSEPLEPALSAITVTAADGKPATAEKAVVDGQSGKRMHVSLPALSPGRYEVRWVAVATDGHRTEGHYVFTVKE